MCGISVIIRKGLDRLGVEHALHTISTLQKHRGPDSSAVWVEELPDLDLTIGLGHQRLSIIDLTDSANQPMHSTSGDSIIIFNGEIYNYKNLSSLCSDELAKFDSKGDTATLLALLNKEGINALPLLNGMWAFAYYTRMKKELIISRDRFGMKPLYYFCDEKQLLFTSEIKPILEIANKKFALNADCVSQYLFQSLLNTSNETFFREINSVPASSYLKIDLARFIPTPNSQPEFCKYWTYPSSFDFKEIGKNPEFELRQTIAKAVERHLISDVKTGLFLSGGLDSSSLLSACIRLNSNPIDCFSVISSSEKFSEEHYIRRISKFCGIVPNLVNSDESPHQFLDELPELLYYNEQPVTSLIVAVHSKLVKYAKSKGVKVLLTGQGVDEQLAGYNKFYYIHLLSLLKKGKLYELTKQLIGTLRSGTILNEFTMREAKRYIPLIRDWSNHTYIGKALEHSKLFSITGNLNLREREIVDIFQTSLPAILHYEDRMSMRHSCEMRVPFLDLEVVNILSRLPDSWQIRNGYTKFALRKAMRAWLPKEVAYRKDKKGFSLPEDRWLREVCTSKVQNTFSGDAMIYDMGLAQRKGVKELFQKFLNNSSVIGFKDIFNLYCMEIWLKQFSKNILT